MRILTTIVFIFVSILSFCSTKINGLAETHKGHKVSLVTYTDHFSYQYKTITSSIVNDSGRFHLNADLNNTQLCFIKIGSAYGGLYLDPNGAYSINFPETDSIATHYSGREHFIGLQFITPDTLNATIESFNNSYDAFLETNAHLFVRRKAKPLVDSFVVAINEQLKLNHPYFEQYKKYNLASLTFSTTGITKSLFVGNINNQPILYHNDAYMAFFNLFYKQFFKTLPINQYDRLIEALKVKMNKNDILELVKLNRYTQNDTIAELVLIKALYENFHHKDFSKKSIIFLLKDIETTTQIFEHKKICTSLIHKLSGVEKGSYAPDYLVTDFDGNKYQLSDLYKEKYVYLDFWATWCKPCIKEMKLTPELHKRYGDDIEFISLSIDKKSQQAKHFQRKNKYDWTFLHFNNNDSLLNDYKVHTIPLYYLIGPGGTVIESPAKRPSDIESDLARISEKIHRKGNMRR